MFGASLRGTRPGDLAKIGFVAQEHPLHRGFTVGAMLHFGRSMNRRFAVVTG